jgi:SM-20-related protein
MKAPFEQLIESFISTEIGVDEHFLDNTLARQLGQNIRDLDKKGAMTYAGIGNQAIQRPQTYRGDKIYWMDRKSKNLYELAFLDKIETFIRYLNKTCYTGITDYEFHYALYDKGSFYKRHTDQFVNDPSRKYSLAIYLNEDWLPEDGGQLVIYKDGKTQSIIPTTQKAVFFRSDKVEHEVSISQKPRMSVTGWLKVKN